MTENPTLAGKAAEAYVWMRLLEHGIVPCLPVVDCQGFDALVKTSDGRCVSLQVKSRGEPLPEGYGNQIKGLWWDKTEKSLAFDYLVIVLAVEGGEGHQAWIVPVDELRPCVSEGGDLTLSHRLLQVAWAPYRENWAFD